MLGWGGGGGGGAYHAADKKLIDSSQRLLNNLMCAPPSLPPPPLPGPHSCEFSLNAFVLCVCVAGQFPRQRPTVSPTSTTPRTPPDPVFQSDIDDFCMVYFPKRLAQLLWLYRVRRWGCLLLRHQHWLKGNSVPKNLVPEMTLLPDRFSALCFSKLEEGRG